MPRRIRGRGVCWNDLRQTRIVIDGRIKMKKKQRANISPETIPFADQARFYNSSCFKACQYVPGSLSNTENSCCSNNRNRGKKETAKKNSGCICLCLQFPTREAVNALADKFKEVQSNYTF